MTTYLALVHEEPEGGFWAEVPALPGCYTQGEKMEEITSNLSEAISGVLEVLREQPASKIGAWQRSPRGTAIPHHRPTGKHILHRLPVADHSNAIYQYMIHAF